MNFPEFLEKVIEHGLEAAREDYKSPEDGDRLVGSVEGFEACRGKNPDELLKLLQEASRQTLEAHRKEARDFWKIRCRESEIEWVCNVVSAVLMNANQPFLVPPTVRGVSMAARILNGEGCIIVEDEAPVEGGTSVSFQV